ncbi:MAG: hrpA [Frankiales bacterium]|nr:hrpA [Frankiales bacterium]
MSHPSRTAPAGRATVPELRSRLGALSLRDEHRLRRRLDRLRGPARDNSRALDSLRHDVESAEARVTARRALRPKLEYPEQLPVSQRRDDLLAAIAAHQVVVVAGETGSGKTTQLPKICLELGRGVRGMIGHTQPRRIAARAVAERLAEELGTTVGDTVGYAVRFTDRVSDNSLVKLMTDGILLAEIQRDRLLRSYDTIIIDEAHERSLNIDFLLGYLQQLLPRRPDLKVIITSATIDPQKFSRYFSDAPIIEVSGRSFPVAVRYRPLIDPDHPEREERDLVTGVADAVQELAGEPAGDVLVFLSGEREIRDTADALNALNLRETEILPLYARLSSAEQHRVFSAHRGRRVVLATNVAETSLTVPGVKYVVDSGTARISRFSNRTKVQLLPIEAISQASARQRAGRCGRTSDGICIRLYTEDDFDARPPFTDPEILRTNLASVILQMASLDLGSVQDFGFIDPPDRRQVADGVALLHELGALAAADSGPVTLTEVGRQIAQLPLDPRLGRMIIEADRRGCVRDVLVLAAALSIQDPRERPAEHQQAADARHARFTDPKSDFSGFLNLWRHVREQQTELSSSQFRRACRSDFLNYLRIREWQDLFAQLRQIARGMGITVDEAAPDGAANEEQIHRSLLAGLLSHIGLKEPPRGDYLGARNAKFAIFPGSALFKKQPQFVMAGELVETSRLWARVNAGIQPEWAEELSPHLVKRSYSEPHWERRRGSVMASERVTLYGVPLVVDRKVGYHQVDPVLSRDLFIRHALVEGDWDTRHAFFAANRELVADLQDLENRARRRDVLVDDETLFAFYDSRIPAEVVSARHFDSWWKRTRQNQPDLLRLTEQDLLRQGAQPIASEEFPDRWTSGSFELDLSYRFEPGAQADGVTATIPLPLLNSASAAGLDWQVPGLRTELVTALLRTLPKSFRRSIVPIPDTAAELVASLPADLSGTPGPLTDVIGAELARLRGVHIPAAAWDPDKLPPHLRPTYRVVGEDGSLLREGKDLLALQRGFAPAVADTLARVTSDLARPSILDWDFDQLERSVRRSAAGHEMTGYPALVETRDPTGARGVAIAVLDSAPAQERAMWAGTRRLLTMTLPSPVKQLRAGLSTPARLSLSRSPHGSLDAVLADCVSAAVDLLMREHGGPVWNRADFESLRSAVAAGLLPAAQRTVEVVASIIGQNQQVELALDEADSQSVRGSARFAAARSERAHLATLIFGDFVTATDARQLRELPRYLRAIEQRLTDVVSAADRDSERQQVVDLVERDFGELAERLAAKSGGEPEPALDGIRWMIEELRVSLFAQRLGTAYPVSVKRIHSAMDALDPR